MTAAAQPQMTSVVGIAACQVREAARSQHAELPESS